MRHRHSVSAVALTAALLAPGFAAAQAPGWIDPPSKAAAPETAKQDATAPRAPAPVSAAAPAEPSGALDGKAVVGKAVGKAVGERSVAAAKSAGHSTGMSAGAAAKPSATVEARAAHVEPGRHRTVQAATARSRRTPAPSETFARVTPDADVRVAEWAGTARHLTAAYLDSLSAPNAVTIAAAPRFYADRIQFHGRAMTLSALMQEKRRFTEHWPERRYVPETQAMRTACDAETATCTVRTPLVFSASNRARGAHSTGVAELVMTVSFASGRPVIVAESSRVLRRGVATVGAPAGSARGA